MLYSVLLLCQSSVCGQSKDLKYRVIIHFKSSRGKIVVLTNLEAQQSYDQVLVEREGGYIAGSNDSEAMEMLGFANFEVNSCKILNDAEQLKNGVNKMMIGWLVEKVAVLIQHLK
jgi:hypothetical protein